MGKNTFKYFYFDQLWHLNPNFYFLPKSPNCNISVSAYPILNLKIELERSRSKKSVVKKPFSDFEFDTSKNQGDSSSSLIARFKIMTPENFLKHGFSFFHWIHPFYFEIWSMWNFGFLFYRTLHLAMNICFQAKCGEVRSWGEELVFKNFLSVESILSQFIT